MYNSDGYVLLDMTGIDLSLSSQYVKGLYNRVTKDCIDCNKMVIVINAGNLTPMSAVINKSLNYYVVTTELYIFKINTNDILIIEEAGSTTVEVAIVPTLLDGVKLADFQVGSTTGAIYAPEQQSEINDTVASDHTTFSSDKIETLLSGKANTTDLATVATTGSYTDLSNKPTIPTKVSELQNDSEYVTGSSLAAVATTGSYTDLTNTPTIPTKVSELQNDSGYITGANYYTKSEVDTALSGKADFSVISGLTIQTQYLDSTVSLFVAYRIGKLVFVKAKLKASNSIGNNYGLIYNLPIPSDVTFSLMPVFKDGSDFNNPTNVKNISAIVNNTGVLTLQIYPDSITSGEWLYINSMYVAN